jgi:hypothetical protein
MYTLGEADFQSSSGIPAQPCGTHNTALNPIAFGCSCNKQTNKPEDHTECTKRKWLQFTRFLDVDSHMSCYCHHSPHHTDPCSLKPGLVQRDTPRVAHLEVSEKSSTSGDLLLNTYNTSCKFCPKSLHNDLALHVIIITMTETHKSVRNQRRLCKEEFWCQWARGWSVMQVAV